MHCDELRWKEVSESLSKPPKHGIRKVHVNVQQGEQTPQGVA